MIPLNEACSRLRDVRRDPDFYLVLPNGTSVIDPKWSDGRPSGADAIQFAIEHYFGETAPGILFQSLRTGELVAYDEGGDVVSRTDFHRPNVVPDRTVSVGRIVTVEGLGKSLRFETADFNAWLNKRFGHVSPETIRGHAVEVTNSHTGDLAASTKPLDKNDLRSWYRDVHVKNYVESGELRPKRDSELQSARDAGFRFVTMAMIKELRRELGPPAWKLPGRNPGKTEKN